MAPAKRPSGSGWFPEERYRASVEPKLVRVPPTKCLQFSGRGRPGGPEFTGAVGALYSVAYTIRFDRTRKGPKFRVPPLEGLYFWKGRAPFPAGKAPVMRWTLLIPMPPFVSAADVKRAQKLLREKGKPAVAQEVRLRTLREGTCVESLHIGPYSTEPTTVRILTRCAGADHRRLKGPHHEIYLSDPRRAKPEKWRTVLRYPVGPRRT